MLPQGVDLDLLERNLTPDELAELDALLAEDIAETPWRPLPGPQQMAYESEADVIGFGGAAGGGKGLALDTLLPTPDGFVSMGDVRVGDTLFDDLGNPCTVTAVSDLSMRQCYRLTFDDGTEVVADDVHRWVTLTASELARMTKSDPEWRARRRASRPSRAKPTTSPARLAALAKLNEIGRGARPAPSGEMRNTREIYEGLRTSSGRANHALPVVPALNLPDVDLPIPPYTLGAWLGDGSSRNAQITGEDDEVWARIEKDGFEVVHYAHNRLAHNILGLQRTLREAGVHRNKHIPPAYFRASYAQRMDLLRGLMDTDGHAALDGGCEYDGTNYNLVAGVLELVQSLGIKATMSEGVAKLNGIVMGPKWRVKFTTGLPVFGLSRKLARLRPSSRRVSKFRYLVACDPIAPVVTKCIAVDSPSRQYLCTTAMLPTHNTDLAIGIALTKHRRVQIFRREGPQLTGIIDRLAEILGSRELINGKPAVYRDTARDVQIEFNSVPNLGDETKYQGRPKDLLVIDEAANFLEAQVRFLKGWVRTTRPGQRTCTLMTFNPPTSAEGRWVVDFFAPWLDPKHALHPTDPGAMRYVYVDPKTGKDVWIPEDDGRQFVLVHGERTYDFDRRLFRPEQIVTPESRTFIPSRITDNPFLVSTGYMAQLQSLPEPLRSQMLLGDFNAGMEDDPWQVIPTRWVEIAQARWAERVPRGEMLSMGVDVARGGKDQTIISTRHKAQETDLWFDRLHVHPGAQTPSGHVVAGLVIAERRDHAPIHIDVIGVGASPYDVLQSADQDVYGVNVSEKATALDASGRLSFFNLRSQLWWQMREALDPAADNGIALPPDPDLAKELCAPRWEMSGMTIKVESRDAIVDRVGRSPDRATAVILALMDTPKVRVLRSLRETESQAVMDYDPYARL